MSSCHQPSHWREPKSAEEHRITRYTPININFVFSAFADVHFSSLTKNCQVIHFDYQTRIDVHKTHQLPHNRLHVNDAPLVLLPASKKKILILIRRIIWTPRIEGRIWRKLNRKEVLNKLKLSKEFNFTWLFN